MNAGLKLKIARIEIGKRQNELAKEVGISSQYLRQLENGRANNPSMGVMLKLAKALNTDAGTLFFSSEK